MESSHVKRLADNGVNIMGQLYSGFCESVLRSIFDATNASNKLCLGKSATQEVSASSYTAQTNVAADWSFSTVNGKATAQNQGKVFFPINSSAASYTTSHFMARARMVSNAPIVYSHAWELGTITVAQNQRVKINAYVSGKHRGISIQLWETT